MINKILILILTLNLILYTNASSLTINHASYPSYVELDPTYIAIDIRKKYPSIINYLINVSGGRAICLHNITPSFLMLLSQKQLTDVFEFLSKHKSKIKWKDQAGIIHSGKTPKGLKKFSPIGLRDRTNTATAMFIYIASIHNDPNLLAKILSAAPKEILEDLKDDARIILSPDVLSRALLIMTNSLPTSSISNLRLRTEAHEIMKNIALIIKQHIKFWSSKKPEQMSDYLSQMLKDTTIRSLNSRQYGALLGSIIAGTSQVFNEIADNYVKKILIANNIANLSVVGTTFIGILGAGPSVALGMTSLIVPVAAGTPIIITPNIVGIATNSEIKYRHMVKEVEGRIELSLLQQMNSTNEDMIHDVLSWMRAAIHVNGLRD